ncbi:tRNA (guanine(37)-N1)-methyltransferase isoform X2 [Ceratina calcarata]|uniref:tRNA (guanine(37)-N1)-methyltransferase n=1 Tax=Ceratina calcarata TaxID=156304 RepID=A0AAJ7WBN3_9HYME|nr:tRNA (guanine(37)-N1)-methyltransferase isoform X2 [Ceratina calcarata]
MIVSGRLNEITRRFLRAQYCSYAKMTSLLVPPESVRGMTRLDRDAFTKTVELPYLRFHDIKPSEILPIMKKYLFKSRRFKPVQNADDKTVIYLDPNLITSLDDLGASIKKQLLEMYEQFEEFGTAKVTLTYDNWQPHDMLRAILPEEIEVPTSFSLIGHIVHLNLRDAHLPYKNIIGEVYLDTVPSARTVVNKTNAIDTTFRNFTMEILAGDKDTVTTVKEHGFTYELDFSQVYWNTRLSTEHHNLVMLMKPKDVLYDVFAGIGPFAVPAARKGVKVFANDLNPESYKWLQRNMIINKVKNNVKCFNMDGREFLTTVFKDDLLNRRANNEIGTEHIVMNLPAVAVDFLDVFFESFNRDEIKRICLRSPIVHLYCFVKANKGQDACKLGQELVERKLGSMLNSDCLFELRHVRNVSTSVEMIRVSFRLHENILKGEEPAMKKLKVDNNFDVIVRDNVPENDGQEEEYAEKTAEQECVQSSESS